MLTLYFFIGAALGALQFFVLLITFRIRSFSGLVLAFFGSLNTALVWPLLVTNLVFGGGWKVFRRAR